MVNYVEAYKAQINAVENFKQQTMDTIVFMIKSISVEPLIVGNVVYFYTNHYGKDVPAYCCLSDYKKGKKEFLPIYNEYNSGLFGWSDFKDCCNIFNIIRDHLAK